MTYQLTIGARRKLFNCFQIYPLHQKSKQNVLNRLWVWNFFGTQPLNLIRHYFGDEIAIYFAWLGSYTSILVVPLVIQLKDSSFSYLKVLFLRELL